MKPDVRAVPMITSKIALKFRLTFFPSLCSDRTAYDSLLS